jgi:hypothetical protein
MSNRKRHESSFTDEPTYTCCVCGTESHRHEALTLYCEAHPKAGEKQHEEIIICCECVEDYKSEAGVEDFLSDTLTQEEYNELQQWCGLNRILLFLSPEDKPRNIQGVEEFFDALTDFISWHPDTSFKDYVRDYTPPSKKEHDSGPNGCADGCAACADEEARMKLFTSEQAIALDELLGDCWEIITQHNKTLKHPKDIYEYGLESFQRAGMAPPDPSPVLSEPVIGQEDCGTKTAPAGNDQKSRPLSDNVCALLLAETETVLTFYSREDLNRAVEIHDHPDFDGRLTQVLRVKGIAFVETQGLVLFETR